MFVKDIITIDVVNYKKPSMFISTNKCSFKCDKDCGQKVCQNSDLVKLPDINISIEKIIKKFNDNSFSEAVVIGGLEPFDSFTDLLNFVDEFRQTNSEDIVIYTGYNKNEIIEEINKLRKYDNIIVKYGRFIPNQDFHYDEVLGVKLASPNQYAERLM